MEAQLIDFYGDKIRVIKQGETDILVSMREICEVLGLGWGAQYRKIKGHPSFATQCVMITEARYQGDREVVCLPYKKIPLWLVLINPLKVRAELRPKLQRYVDEVEAFLVEKFIRPASPVKPVTAFDALEVMFQSLREQRAKSLEFETRIDEVEKQVVLANSNNSAKTGYYTVRGYCNLKKMHLSLVEANQFGRMVSTRCRAIGIPKVQVPDEMYGTVRSYPEALLDEVAAEFLGIASA